MLTTHQTAAHRRYLKTTPARIDPAADAQAWLEGRPCGFFEFKGLDELILLWQAHGDTAVATWDLGRDTKPVARD
jgi:hypothetical protein